LQIGQSLIFLSEIFLQRAAVTAGSKPWLSCVAKQLDDDLSEKLPKKTQQMWAKKTNFDQTGSGKIKKNQQK
jgi:hypothetical protein